MAVDEVVAERRLPLEGAGTALAVTEGVFLHQPFPHNNSLRPRYRSVTSLGEGGYGRQSAACDCWLQYTERCGIIKLINRIWTR